MSRKLMIVVFLGVIAIVASPFTQMISPRNVDYGSYEYHDDFILDDNNPMVQFGVYADGERIIIQELTTNGTPVVVELVEYHLAETSEAILQNVTSIRHVNIVGTSSNWTLLPIFRVTRQENRSAQVHLIYRILMHPHQDVIITGPSGIELLVLPLIYMTYKNWGKRPDRRGYALLFVIILSAALIAPLYAFVYNNESALDKSTEILALRTYTFLLNASHPLQEFTESIESGDPDVFVRITNLTTDGIPVSVSFSLESISEVSELYNVTTFPDSMLQFEVPTENLTSLTVRVGQMTQNANVSLSIATIRDVWTPGNNIVPYYLIAAVGLGIFVIALIFPERNPEPPESPKKEVPNEEDFDQLVK